MRAELLGVLFDFDGVIIDSHLQHERAWFRLAEEMGKEFTHELFVESFGMRNENILGGLLGWVPEDDQDTMDRLGVRKEALYREVLRQDGIEALPGVSELLDQLGESGVPCCIGTSTARENVDLVLGLIGLEKQFAGICSAEDVSRGKPEPDVFLGAARRISREPAHCVVIEDAHVGIEAGKRAGAKVIAVTTTHSRETFEQADRVVDSLEEVSLEGLLSLW